MVSWKRNLADKRRQLNRLRDYENGTFVLTGFKTVSEDDVHIEFEFNKYENTHKVPKSMICDDRFKIGRTTPKTGHDLCVVSWYFHEHLKKSLKKSVKR